MTALQHEARVAIRVYGTPIPQGSKTANARGRGVRDANATHLKPWRAHVTAQARDAWTYHDTITGPVRIWLRFTFTRPPSHYGTGRNNHVLKDSAPTYPGHGCGDLDKLTRAILDALDLADVYADDSQVVEVRAIKAYAGDHENTLDRDGVDIILEPITPELTP